MITLIRAVAVCTLSLFAGVTHAQTGYPNRPVRVIVPFAPGGPSDVIARLLMQKFSENLGQQFYVENHAGGGGNLGTAVAARATPDGYTILVASSSFMINPGLYAKVPYDPYNDFDPVTEIATTPNVLVVHPSVPAKSVAELIRYAKAHPGTLNYSSPGNGSGAHLAGELFKSMAGVDIVHIPFNGIAPAVAAVVGGQVQMMFAGAPSALPQVKAGRLVALGVASPKRSAAAPELPTLAESGLPGFDVTSWYSIVAPAGTPNEIIARLRSEIAAALAQADIQEKLAGLGAEPIGNTPAEFAAMIKVETAKWGKIVKDANIQVE